MGALSRDATRGIPASNRYHSASGRFRSTHNVRSCAALDPPVHDTAPIRAAVTCAHARPRWWRTVTGAAGSRASVRDRSRTPAARWAGSARAREAGCPVPARLAARVALWGFNSGFMGVQLGCEVILGYFTGLSGPARRMLPGASWEMLHDLPGQGRAARRRGEPTPAARIAGPLSWAFTSQAERHAAKSSRNSPVIIPVLVTFIG